MLHHYSRVSLPLLTLLLAAVNICGAQNRSVIYAARPTTSGIVTYPSASTVTSHYVDGYIRITGTTKFLAPVGDNGAYRPFATAANEVQGAYFKADPNVCITSDPKGGNYPALPKGAPFATSKKNSAVGKISTKEYWDINSTASSKITLTWDAASDIAGLLEGATLSKLYIVGWNTQDKRWYRISSLVDANSALGGTSTLASGSITTTYDVVINKYDIYTLGTDETVIPKSSARLTAFAGEQEDDHVNLTLPYSTDERSVEILKQTGIDTWESLGHAPSLLDTLDSFKLVDINPVVGNNHYQLRFRGQEGDETTKNLNVKFISPLKITAYPNPAKDYIQIGLPDSESSMNIKIINVTGKTEILKKINSGESIDLNRLSPGVYIIHAINANGMTATKSFIITK